MSEDPVLMRCKSPSASLHRCHACCPKEPYAQTCQIDFTGVKGIVRDLLQKLDKKKASLKNDGHSNHHYGAGSHERITHDAMESWISVSKARIELERNKCRPESSWEGVRQVNSIVSFEFGNKPWWDMPSKHNLFSHGVEHTNPILQATGWQDEDPNYHVETKGGGCKVQVPQFFCGG